MPDTPDLRPDDERPGAGIPDMAELFARHLPDLAAYVRRRSDPLVAAKEAVDDLVQSVCREVVEHEDRFRHDSEEGFRRWLFRTAERKIIDRYRYYTAGRRDSSREQRPHPDGPHDPAALGRLAGLSVTPSMDAVAREELGRIERAFGALPETYRLVIVLSRFERLSHAEIADRLGRSEGAVRNLLYRGLAALAAALDAPPPAPSPARGRPSGGRAGQRTDPTPTPAV